MNGYGTVYAPFKVTTAVNGSDTLQVGDFSAEQRWDVDEIDIVIGVLTSGIVRVGYGALANNPMIYETDAVTSGESIRLKNLGVDNINQGAINVYYNADAVDVKMNLGAHMVKQTKKVWLQQTAPAFAARTEGKSISFNGNLLFMGGKDATTVYNDVWQSTDNGETWTEITGVPFTARWAFGLVELDGALYVIGGHSNVGATASLNDVWKSLDGGATWTIIQPSASFLEFGEGLSVVLGSLIYVYSGYNGNTGIYSQTVWSSPDGITWTEVALSVPWVRRKLAGGLNWNNKLWLIGGRNAVGARQDVWSSRDGNQWIQDNEPLPFPARYGFGVLPFNQNRNLYLFGGSGDGTWLNDVWSSPDAGFWYEENASADFSAREGFASCIHNRSIFIIGGINNLTYYNDVFRTNLELM